MSENRFYIVKVELKSEDPYLNKFSEICLNKDSSLYVKPNAAYVNNKTCLLIFSKGSVSNNDLISKYTCIFHKYNERFIDDISVTVIEFESPVKLIFYIKWQIENLCISLCKKLSNGSITDKITCFKANREIYDILKKDHNVDWDKIDNEDKYGKIISVSDTSVPGRFDVLSENIDIRDMTRYISYIK